MKQGNDEGEWQNVIQIFIQNSRKDIKKWSSNGCKPFLSEKIQINHVMVNEPVNHA